MDFMSNIWKHPKTSLTGVLIAVAGVAGVLTQQGVTLGKVGGGTVVSLASALATLLLGLMAKDPGTGQQVSESTSQPAAPNTLAQGSLEGDPGSGKWTNAKLGAWLLIALLIPLPWMQGCTATSVAQNIVNWTPSLESAVATVDSTAVLLAPADGAVFAAATAGFDAASNLLVAQAKAYLANPSATLLAQLQAQIVVLEQQVNTSLLQTARIVDAKSQQHAMAAIQAVATIVGAILSLVQSISSEAAVAQMAAQSTVKLEMVRPYLDDAKAAETVAAHYGEPVTMARTQVAQGEQLQINAGL